ncbi:MAG: DUF4250 domain-containing protein [Pilosibacter sp.]
MVWKERIIRERGEMVNIPKDPVMLLSYINTQLRDNYPDMDELCRSLCLDRKDVDEKLASIDYEYDPEKISMYRVSGRSGFQGMSRRKIKVEKAPWKRLHSGSENHRYWFHEQMEAEKQKSENCSKKKLRRRMETMGQEFYALRSDGMGT